MTPSTPDTVAVAGDWHGNSAWAVHAITNAVRRGAEAIVHTGDFGLWPGTWGKKYLDDLDDALDKHGVNLWWVDGNHDDHNALAAWPIRNEVHPIRDRITHLPRGHRWSWHGNVWLALGGAVSVDRGHRSPNIDWWPTEVITDADVEAAIAGGPADVMICHDAPDGVANLDQWLSVNGFKLNPALQADCDANRRRVREVVDAVHPQVLFHGHYHRRYTDTVGTTAIEGIDCDGDKMARNLVLIDTRTLQVRGLFDGG